MGRQFFVHMPAFYHVFSSLTSLPRGICVFCQGCCCSSAVDCTGAGSVLLLPHIHGTENSMSENDLRSHQASWEKVLCKNQMEKDGEMRWAHWDELLQEPVIPQASRSRGGSISGWCLQPHSVFLVRSASNPSASHGAELCSASYGNAEPPVHPSQSLAAQMPSVSVFTLTAATMALQNAFICTKCKVHAREGQPW